MRIRTGLTLLIASTLLTASFPNLARASGLDRCENIFALGSREQKAEARSSENVLKYEPYYSTRRGIESYTLMLGKEFENSVERLFTFPEGHWFDSGAGQAFAVRQVLERPEASRLKATVVAYETSAKDSERLKVISGRFIETIADAEIPESHLITDVVGPIAYSGQPHLVLQKYFNRLHRDGEIYLYLGSRFEHFGQTNQVLTAKGELLTFGDWLTTLPGVKTQLIKKRLEDDGSVYERWVARITKLRPEVQIPAVEMVYFKEGAPPAMIFKEVGNQGVPSIKTVKEQARAAFKKIMASTTASQFLDAFRGGELRHPLIASLKRLKKEDRWVNSSEIGDQIFAGMKEKDYPFNDTTVFNGLAQKFIRWRALGIKTDKMVYTPLSDSAPLKDMRDVKLITDFNGDFVSSYAPDVVLERYTNALSNKGEIYLYMGKEYGGFGSESMVLTKEGKKIALRYWVKNIPGLTTSLFRGGYHWHGGEWAFLRIKVSHRSKIQIPKLKLVGVQPDKDGIPMAFFEEI